MKEFEIKYKEFQAAKNKAEQHMFPLIFMVDGMIEKHYKELKNNYDRKQEELFIKNVDIVLNKIS